MYTREHFTYEQRNHETFLEVADEAAEASIYDNLDNADSRSVVDRELLNVEDGQFGRS